MFCVGEFIYKANIKAKKVKVILTRNKQLEGSHHVTEQNKETEKRRPEATGTHSREECNGTVPESRNAAPAQHELSRS